MANIFSSKGSTAIFQDICSRQEGTDESVKIEISLPLDLKLKMIKHHAETGENASRLIERLLREAFEK